MNTNSKKLVRSALLLALAIAIQAIGSRIPQLSQLFVGSVVNAVLLMGVMICGTTWACMIGGLTPLLAWLIGQLAAPMGPFVPFIMIGNIILVLIFGLLYSDSKIRQIAGLILGAFLKFCFLYLSASKLVALFNLGIPKPIASKLVIMMGIPQLTTALIGGFIALLLFNILNKRKAL